MPSSKQCAVVIGDRGGARIGKARMACCGTTPLPRSPSWAGHPVLGGGHPTGTEALHPLNERRSQAARFIGRPRCRAGGRSPIERWRRHTAPRPCPDLRVRRLREKRQRLHQRCPKPGALPFRGDAASVVLHAGLRRWQRSGIEGRGAAAGATVGEEVVRGERLRARAASTRAAGGVGLGESRGRGGSRWSPVAICQR